MKRTLVGLVFVGLATLGSAANAATITIDFETPPSFQPIGDYYGGGAGPNLGVTFGLDALAIQNDALGPYFSNAPSPIGVLAPVGTGAAMNVASGFTGSASFSYSSSAAATIGVYSGLNATGNLLASIVLADNTANCPISQGTGQRVYCAWTLGTLPFTGVARSIGFGAASANDVTLAAFDDVRVTRVVPEPASAALVAAGLVGLALRRRSRRVELRCRAR
jgi:hypothetical protein